MFFEPRHQELAARLRAAAPAIAAVETSAGQGEAARDAAAVAALGDAGLFGLVAGGSIDVRSICLARELLGWVSPRADSIFAVQGLGAYPLSLAKAHLDLVTKAAEGDAVLAFALTEPEAGSDVGAIATHAVPSETGGWILDGEKTLISNLGVATHAIVFATLEPGAKGATRAFVVPIDTPGVKVEPMQATAPHPIGRLILRGAKLPASALVGGAPDTSGLRLALATLDTFRVTVGAAAVGMARRAMHEAITHVRARVQFGAPLATQPLVQAHLADMAVDLDAARLLVLRAAFAKDAGEHARTEVSIAKLGATEAAQRVIDRAVQLVGGRGVMAGAVVEHLYRAIRPLRIYEGTSEIQRTIIGKAVAEHA
ncbi:MAG TPA: acyl-CoA dehydrogenase [Kofleriaceae bacterium]|nr:acyl-CoA dehydrogenase [Kofleriaceae bacterium]